MKQLLKSTLLAILLFPGLWAQGQLNSVVRGRVFDKTLGYPLIGVHVMVFTRTDTLHAITDTLGQFSITNVTLGRFDISTSYIGYKPVRLNQLFLRSGKEFVANIEMDEEPQQIDAVEIKTSYQKDRPLNQMAQISARSFSIEETNKYAGSYGDPARMAMNYAGVLPARDNRNDIIIRGNTSSSLQYRLDGIEIPNPNHFGATGTTGGPITVLNTNLLANSDFMTGAFPADYGNVIGGVFDLKTRFGNTEHHEQWFQMGWNGLEFGSEGPLVKEKTATYMFSYRYSLTGLLSDLGVKFQEQSDYQDINFKLHFPTQKAGTFSLIGMGGKSGITIKESEHAADDWLLSWGEDLYNDASIGVTGLSHTLFMGRKIKIQTSISAVGSSLRSRIDTLSPGMTPRVWAGEASQEIKGAINERITYKPGKKDVIYVGGQWQHTWYDYADSQKVFTGYRTNTHSEGNYSIVQAYAGWRHAFTSNLSTYVGIQYIQWSLVKAQHLEPRASIEWNVAPRHTISLGYGLHSQQQAGIIYFVRDYYADDSRLSSNNTLLPSQSQHFIASYNYSLAEHARLKAEAYLQLIDDAPVSDRIGSYSVLNAGTEFFFEREPELVNTGTGKNYGVELTLERFFYNNYYLLATGSWFRSLYTGSDKIERSTAFDGKYAMNLLGGYELFFPKRGAGILFGVNLTYGGGRPYVPYDIDNTLATGEVQYDWANAYSVRREDYKRASLRIGFKRNREKFNMETIFDFQYRSNYTNIYYDRIDVTTGEIKKAFKMGFYPMATLRIQF